MISSHHLTAALADLPERVRRVYLLSARDGLSDRTIAGQLGITTTQVEHELAQALAALERRIGTIRAAGAVAPDRMSR